MLSGVAPDRPSAITTTSVRNISNHRALVAGAHGDGGGGGGRSGGCDAARSAAAKQRRISSIVV